MKEIDSRVEALDKMILLLKERKAKDKAGFQIFVKNIDGKTYTIDKVKSTLSVEDLKTKIEDKIGLPVEEQRLIHQGKQLENAKIVGHYKIEKESTIHLLLRLKGGGYGEILVEIAASLGVEATFGSVAIALGISTATLWGGLIMGGIGLTWSISKIINYLKGNNVEESDEDENVGFQIFIKNQDGKTYTIDGVEDEMTLAELKGKIAEKIGLPIEEQSLSFQREKLIEENQSMFDYKIDAGLTLFLSVVLPVPDSLEKIKENAKQLLERIQGVQATFDFLTEETSANFQNAFDDLIALEEVEESFELHEELIVVYESTQEKFHLIIDEKIKACEDLAINVNNGLLKLIALNKSKFLVAGAEVEMKPLEEEDSSIEEEELSLLKIEKYNVLIEKIEAAEQKVRELINEKEKEWKALIVVAEEQIDFLKDLEVHPFLERKSYKVCENLLAVPNLESIFEQITEYNKLVKESKEKIRLLNQIIGENKTNYNTTKQGLSYKLGQLVELQAQKFLEGENFEKVNAFILTCQNSLKLDPSLECLKELKKLDAREDYNLMLESLAEKRAANEISWNKVKEEASGILVNVEKLSTSDVLKNENIVPLEDLKQEHGNLNLLEYSLENKQAHTAFIEKLGRESNTLEEFRVNKNNSYNQLDASMLKDVRLLVKEYKHAGDAIAEEGRNRMKEDKKRLKKIDQLKTNNTLQEINGANVFVDEFIVRHTLILENAKGIQLASVATKMNTLKDHITAYYNLIRDIQAKFEIRIYEHEYEDILVYKDCYSKNERLELGDGYSKLKEGIAELDRAIAEIQVGMMPWEDELAKEVEDSSGWNMNPILFIREGISRDKIEKVGEGVEHLDKLSRGELNDRHGGDVILINKPMHKHLEGGKKGMSFYYRKEENGSVTPIVYDYANKRLGNKYKWTYGKVSSAPSDSK